MWTRRVILKIFSLSLFVVFSWCRLGWTAGADRSFVLMSRNGESTSLVYQQSNKNVTTFQSSSKLAIEIEITGEAKMVIPSQSNIDLNALGIRLRSYIDPETGLQELDLPRPWQARWIK